MLQFNPVGQSVWVHAGGRGVAVYNNAGFTKAKGVPFLLNISMVYLVATKIPLRFCTGGDRDGQQLVPNKPFLTLPSSLATPLKQLASRGKPGKRRYGDALSPLMGEIRLKSSPTGSGT